MINCITPLSPVRRDIGTPLGVVTNGKSRLPLVEKVFRVCVEKCKNRILSYIQINSEPFLHVVYLYN